MLYLGNYISDDDFVQRLIDAGWTREEAQAELERILADAAEEDGME